VTGFLRYHGEVLNDQGRAVTQVEALSGGLLGPPSIEVSFRLQAVGAVLVRLSRTEATELRQRLREALDSVQNEG
jgi:hypothetical protein